MRIIAILLVLLSSILQEGCITTKEKEVVKPSSKMTLKECLDQGNPPWICDQITSGTVPPLPDSEEVFGTIPKVVPSLPKSEETFGTIPKEGVHFIDENG